MSAIHSDILAEKLELARRRLVMLSFWIFLSSSVLFTLLYFFSGSFIEAGATFTVGLLTLGVPLLLQRSETSLNAAYLVVILFFLLLNFIVVFTGGLRSDTLHWLVLVPVFAQVLINRSAARSWLIVLLLEMVVLFGLESINFFNIELPDFADSIFRTISIAILFSVGYGIVSSFEGNIRLILDEVNRSKSALEESKAAAETRAELIQQSAVIVAEATSGMEKVLHEGSSAMETLKKEMSEIDVAAQRMLRFVQEAVHQSKSVQTAIAGLQEQTQKIRRVLDLVNSIATQTNLLALNASVEASRAGAAGSGFQVVASEVKMLAGKSKEAINEIDEVVRSLHQQMDQTVREVKSSAAKIEQVTEAHREISQSLSMQQHASEKVLSNLQSALEVSHQLSQRAEMLSSHSRR
jgi:uncharacterized protein Yka (UPF0111/DUF47 family)